MLKPKNILVEDQIFSFRLSYHARQRCLERKIYANHFKNVFRRLDPDIFKIRNQEIYLKDLKSNKSFCFSITDNNVIVVISVLGVVKDKLNKDCIEIFTCGNWI